MARVERRVNEAQHSALTDAEEIHRAGVCAAQVLMQPPRARST